MYLAIRGGDIPALEGLVERDPGLASARFVGRNDGTRTALHMVADWPGYFPGGPEIVRLLIGAGSDPNARTTGDSPVPGPGDETPLHWGASSDDLDVARALIDGGADIEAAQGSIGTPLDNAVGYRCFHVARLLVERGAVVEREWQAAALGMLDRLEALLGDRPEDDDVSEAFWHACAGGQRRAAEYLLGLGADVNWEPQYAQGTALDVSTGPTTRQENVTTWLREQGARSSHSDS
jgi:ankyrin repeat protein